MKRTTAILEAVAKASEPVRLRSLVALLDAPKSSVHGLVRGLVATGYLRDVDGGYRLGPAVTTLLASSQPPLIEAVRPSMEALRDQLGETVMLATLVGDSIVYLDALESTELIRYSPPLRERRPAYPTSAGKCLLAHAADQRRLAYLERYVPDAGGRARIEHELRRVREAGVALNQGETLPDITAAAAPVHHAGQAVAALACAGPTHRVRPRLELLSGAVREKAADASRQLG